MENKKTFYRYTYTPYYSGYHTLYLKVIINLEEWVVLRETPKGYWIIPDAYKNWHSSRYVEKAKKWISKYNTKFAWETKELALRSFVKRQNHNVQHCERRLNEAREALRKAKLMEEKNAIS